MKRMTQLTGHSEGKNRKISSVKSNVVEIQTPTMKLDLALVTMTLRTGTTMRKPWNSCDR